MRRPTGEDAIRVAALLLSIPLLLACLQRALARITGAEDTSWRGVMRRVAELAYRPTTQVQVAPDGRYHCFACGHDGKTEPTGGLNYCEQCGAEVTN